MQEELEQKSVAISIKAGKLTANLLKKAVEKALAEMEKSQKNPKIYKGKQSVKHLVRQGAGVSNIEITDGNIKSFERVARKYFGTLAGSVLCSHWIRVLADCRRFDCRYFRERSGGIQLRRLVWGPEYQFCCGDGHAGWYPGCSRLWAA